MKKRVAVFGSTGSIGKSTLKVVRHLSEELSISVLVAKSNIELLEEQARAFRPKLIAVYDEEKALLLQKKLPEIRVLGGLQGLIEAASFSDTDFVLLAMSGILGLEPAIAAIEAGKQIGLANKEILVSAGELITELARKKAIPLLPVDSEHSALFQCLQGAKKREVRRLILTASGGPFFQKTEGELAKIGVEDALAHPNWKMGPKVTIDSSTLMNKGLEMIEAKWLFDVAPRQIEVVIHPQSIVHSLVEFIDGSLLAQVSSPDMILPIQYALTYPNRLPGLLPPFDFSRAQQWTFSPPDHQKFRCLTLAKEALAAGQSYPCFLNAANEVLVERFLRKEISWIAIGEKLDQLISSHHPEIMVSLEAILNVDSCARQLALNS